MKEDRKHTNKRINANKEKDGRTDGRTDRQTKKQTNSSSNSRQNQATPVQRIAFMAWILEARVRVSSTLGFRMSSMTFGYDKPAQSRPKKLGASRVSAEA